MADTIGFDRKYRVFYEEDISIHLNPTEESIFDTLSDKIARGRWEDCRDNPQFLVVKTTESYAPSVAKILQLHNHCNPRGPIRVPVDTPRNMETLARAVYDKWVSIQKEKGFHSSETCPSNRPDAPFVLRPTSINSPTGGCENCRLYMCGYDNLAPEIKDQWREMVILTCQCMV